MVTVVEFLNAAIKGKPLDASDAKDLATAQSELARLRRVCSRVCDILDPGSKQRGAAGAHAEGAGPSQAAGDDGGDSKTKGKKGHRQALKEDDAHTKYVKKAVPKSAEDRALIKKTISQSPLFKQCSYEDLEDFVDVFAKKTFSKGSTIIKQGDVGELFYVVDSGTLDIFINTGAGAEMQVGVPYSKGGSFGELALIYNSRRAATIRCDVDCVLWEISRIAFKGLRHTHEKKIHASKVTELGHVKVNDKTFSEVLGKDDIESMALATQTVSFESGQAIVREGEKGDTFYVITEGDVDVFKKAAGKDKIATLGVHSFFGEKALLEDDVRQATCVAQNRVHCLTLQREDFNRMLGNLNDILSGKRQAPTPNKMLQRPSSSVVKDLSFTMDDLEKRNMLGEGAFGRVNLVKDKRNKELYALKAQGKAFVVENGQQKHLLTEYQLMKELDHVFIVKCHAALQDKKYVYFVMTLLPGGELMDLLDAQGEFPEAWTKFYGATVLSAFCTMHEKKIAYRDLKPENLVLNEQGYCYVIDFGLATKIDNGKTWTFCGTPDYLAPEIIRGKGHDWGVDYWGLGVLLYELTHGYPPFYATDPTGTARKILKGTFSFPPKFSTGLTDIISRLLCDQSKRLGRIQGGGEAVMKHQWFTGFDWDSLLNKTMPVPYTPKLGSLENLGSKDDGPPTLAPDSTWNPVME